MKRRLDLRAAGPAPAASRGPVGPRARPRGSRARGALRGPSRAARLERPGHAPGGNRACPPRGGAWARRTHIWGSRSPPGRACNLPKGSCISAFHAGRSGHAPAPAVNLGPRPGVGALWWSQRGQRVPSSTRSGGDPHCLSQGTLASACGPHPSRSAAALQLPSVLRALSPGRSDGVFRSPGRHRRGPAQERAATVHTGHPETSFLLLLCRDWAPRDGARGLLGSRVGLSALQPGTPQVDWGLDVTGPASHRNARVGPRGWGRSMRPRPQGREPDLYFLSWGALGTDESRVCPLASAQGSESHGAPGLPGPRQGETRRSLPALVTPSWGVRDSSPGGGGPRRAPSSPSLLTPPPPQPHPLGSWAEPGSDPGQVAWPLCPSPSSLTRGHHGLQIGSQASLGDGDGTDNAPIPSAPGHPLWESAGAAAGGLGARLRRLRVGELRGAAGGAGFRE